MALKLKINFDSLLKLPLSKKAGILAVVNVVIAGLLYWFITGPKYAEVKNLTVQMDELNVKLNENRSIAADIPRYLSEKEEMEKKLSLAIAQLPNEKEIPDLIDSISASGENAGLKIMLFKPGREVPKGFYAEIPVNMSVEGKFESMFNFSYRVSRLPRIVNVGNLDIVSQGHKNRIPSLKANFVATTFRFIPGPPEVEQKK